MVLLSISCYSSIIFRIDTNSDSVAGSGSLRLSRRTLLRLSPRLWLRLSSILAVISSLS
jgi:hypothetical protein